METLYVSLPTVEDAHAFVVQISTLDGNFDLLSGRYVLDAKSLMGILTLDLSKPLMLRVEKATAETMKALARFAVSGGQPGKQLIQASLEG